MSYDISAAVDHRLHYRVAAVWLHANPGDGDAPIPSSNERKITAAFQRLRCRANADRPENEWALQDLDRSQRFLLASLRGLPLTEFKSFDPVSTPHFVRRQKYGRYRI